MYALNRESHIFDCQVGALMRNVVFYVAGVRHEAPEAWMIGAHFQRVRRGMDPKEAYLDAMKHWAQQAQMAAEFEANQ